MSTNGRLTLSSGVAVPASDISGVSTLYWTPLDGSSSEISHSASGLSANTNYDVFLVSGALSLTAWSSDTARASALTFTGGLPYDGSGNPLLGTIRTTGAGFEDSAMKRFVSNVYNQVPRRLRRGESDGSSWEYGTATWRQANANGANRVEIVNALDGMPVSLRAMGVVTNDDSTDTGEPVRVGIGVDSTSTPADGLIAGTRCYLANSASPVADYVGYPGIGYHALNWLERGGGGASGNTWRGDSATFAWKTGLVGEVWA